MPVSKKHRRIIFTLCLTLLSFLTILSTTLRAQNSIDVRGDRWLRIQSITGEVQFFTANSTQPAQVGDLLTMTGDGMRTGRDSSGVLAVDNDVGTITLRESTVLMIQTLDFASDNGNITRLLVPQGSVILNLRRFTHRGSELEIETPTGVSGVRGTSFGIIVHPTDQRTAVATESGAVFAESEGTSVNVLAGFQTLIREGEPLLEPQPIPAEPVFDYRVETTVRDNLRYLTLVGRIDPINQVYVEDELQEVTNTGEFRYESLAHYGAEVTVKIVTPLDDTFTYDISLL